MIMCVLNLFEYMIEIITLLHKNYKEIFQYEKLFCTKHASFLLTEV